MLLIVLMLFNACLTDPCNGVFCSETGECIDGICKCEAGFSGENCSSTLAADIAGDYEVFSSCVDSAYLSSISSSSSIDLLTGIKASNMLDLGSIFCWGGVVNSQTGTDLIIFYEDTLSVTDSTQVIYSVSGTGFNDTVNDEIIFDLEYLIDGTALMCRDTFRLDDN